MPAGTYSPESVIVIFGSRAYGLADGEFLSIEPDEPIFEDAQGADGAIGRTKNPGRMAMARLTLLQVSTFNAVLSALAISGDAVPFLVREGATVIASGEAWVKELPVVSYSKEMGSREWGIRLAKAEPYLVGGNPT